MEILLDTANINEIKKILEHYPIDGFTTNPSILSKEACSLEEWVPEIKAVIGTRYMLHVQTTGQTAEMMVAQGEKLRDYFGDKFFLKIPITRQGIKAVKECKKRKIGVTVTAVFTATQALIAAKAGADYVAPYINRMENIGVDSEKTLESMVNILKNYNYQTKIIGASFKNVLQIEKMARLGVHSITLQPELLKESISHPYTDKSLTDFERDWKNSFSEKEITDFLKF